MKTLSLLLLGLASLTLPACVSVDDEEPVRTTSTTTVTEETAVTRPAVTETRTIRSY